MNRLQQLQDRKAAIQKLMKDASEKIASEDRVLPTEEELADRQKSEKDLESIDKEIAWEQKVQTSLKESLAKSDSIPVGGVILQDPPKEPVIKFPHTYGRLKNFQGPDAKLNAYTSGMFLLATLFRNEKAAQWCKEHGVQLAQSEGVNTAGGYLVPPQMTSTIIDLRETYGRFRANTTVMPMSSDSLSFNRRASGLTAYYVNEASAITDSTMGWDPVTLTAKKLAVLTYLSSEVNEDAMINMMDVLAGEMAYQFAYAEDQAGFIGDGTSAYGGIQGVMTKILTAPYTASVYDAITGNTAFSTLDLADFHGMTGKLPLYARARAKWYISPAGFSDSMERLAYAGGGNTTSNITGSSGLSFLGYPVELIPNMNSTLTAQTSTGLFFFGDLAMASALGSRKDISVAMSDQYRFNQDQLAIRATQRYDINVHSLGSTTAAGPLIVLKTPGA